MFEIPVDELRRDIVIDFMLLVVDVNCDGHFEGQKSIDEYNLITETKNWNLKWHSYVLLCRHSDVRDVTSIDHILISDKVWDEG